MMIVENLPELEVDNYQKYCHIVCECSDKLTLCGGYKAKLCGTDVEILSPITICNVCNKVICLDCLHAFKTIGCPRCGG